MELLKGSNVVVFKIVKHQILAISLISAKDSAHFYLKTVFDNFFFLLSLQNAIVLSDVQLMLEYFN